MPERGNLTTSALGLSIKYFSKRKEQEREKEYKSVLVLHYGVELGETNEKLPMILHSQVFNALAFSEKCLPRAKQIPSSYELGDIG